MTDDSSWMTVKAAAKDEFSKFTDISPSDVFQLDPVTARRTYVPSLSTRITLPIDTFTPTSNPYFIYFNSFPKLIADAARLLDRALDDSKMYDDLCHQRFLTRFDIAEFFASHDLNQRQYNDPAHGKHAVATADLEIEEFKKLTDVYETIIGLLQAVATARANDAPVTQNYWALLHDAQARHTSFGATVAQADVKKNILKSKLAFAEKDREYRKEQLDIAQSLGYCKLDEYNKPDGALNFSRRIGRVIERVEADVRETVYQCAAIELGMELILEMPVPFDIKETDPDALYSMTAWLRNVHNTYNRVMLAYQPTIVRISLDRLTSSTDLKTDLRDGVSFTIGPETLGLKAEKVLLTAVSASGVGLSTGQWMDIEIQGPSQGFVRQSTGLPIQLPKFRLRAGRVRAPGGAFEEDRIAAPSVQNRSPFGDWRVVLVSQSAEMGPISDIYMDLHALVKF